jgi:hypothetical protein
MSFEPQDDNGTLTRVSGILAVKDGKFIVVDRTTNVTMQVQGAGLEAAVGNLVEITGTLNPSAPVAAGASQLIDSRHPSVAKLVGQNCARENSWHIHSNAKTFRLTFGYSRMGLT